MVYIDDEGNVFVNSEKLEEDYVKDLSYGNCDITFPFQVPDKEVFVLGDNRESSIDSRNKSIGSISTDRILGKIIININQLCFY
jgi:signal peptidase I